MNNSPLSILLIEEDSRSRNFLTSLLSSQKYSVLAVSSGKEGFISALRDRPEVIIIDTSLSDLSAIELVKKLRADKRTATTICIALSLVSNAENMSSVLAAGCNEFFVKTQDSIEKLLALLSNPTLTQPNDARVGGARKQRSNGMLAVFLSAKGGLGTSSMCANIAQNIAASNPELEVAVLDLVLPIGSIASIVGYNGDFGILSATSRSLDDLNSEFLHHILTPLENWRFRFLAGSPDPETANSLDLALFATFTRTFRDAFDLTCIDLGRSLSNPNLAIIQEADVVVIITGTDPTTVNLTHITWQYLQRNGIKPQHVYLLLNRSMGLEGLSKSDAEQILGMEIRATTPYLGGTFSLANNQHLPIKVKLPNDTAAMMIDQTSREILETARRNRV